MAIALVAWTVSCGGRTDAGASDRPSLVTGDDAYGGEIPSFDASLADDPPMNPDPSSAPTDPVGNDAPDDEADPALDANDDAGGDAGCTAALGPGVLLIDEMLIESVDGTGDHGEWLEVANTLACAVNLRGLHGDCPHGAKAATFDVAGDLWIPAGGSFVVADSVSPALDHDVPLPVVAWQGAVGDVLRNKGTTVTLSLSGTIVDTLTYPALPLTVGTSLEFPSDCDPATRDDFSRWQPAQASWFPGFHGTPNAPNTDVACAK